MTLPPDGIHQIPSIDAEFGSEMIKTFAALGRRGGYLSQQIDLTMKSGDVFYLTHIAHLESDTDTGIMVIYGKGKTKSGKEGAATVRVRLELNLKQHKGTIAFNS